MKKILATTLLAILLATAAPVMAGTHGKNGKVSGRSIGAGFLSLIIWPGLGQAVNDQPYEKKCNARSFRLNGNFQNLVLL